MEGDHQWICEQAELKTLLNELDISCKMQEKEAKYHILKLQEETLKIKQVLSKISSLMKAAEQKGNVEEYETLYRKALEERDEYKLKAHSQACTIMKLETELSKLKNCALDNANNCLNTSSYLDKEIDFLHKENASLRNEVKYLKNQLNDKEQIKKELSNCKIENITIKENIIKKQTEFLEMQFQFDSKLKKLQSEYNENTSNLQKKLLEYQEALNETKISKDHTESYLKENYAFALSKIKELQQQHEKLSENHVAAQSDVTECPLISSQSLMTEESDFTETEGTEHTTVTTITTITKSSSTTTTEKILKTPTYSSDESAEKTDINSNPKIKLKSEAAVCLLDEVKQPVNKEENKEEECEDEDLSEEEVEICTLL